MDAAQLEKRIQKDEVMKNDVWGVFARNELPSHLLPGGYVVNSDDRGSPGQHWMAVYVTEDGMVEFMDSFGRKPQDYKLDLNCTYYSRAVQSANTGTCGLYVLYYLFWRCRGIPMHVIMSTLNNPNNDTTVNHHYALML
jgi:hypothetical protein